MTDPSLPSCDRPTGSDVERVDERYPSFIRLLQWSRAALIAGMLASGWLMTRLGDGAALKYGTLYPLHKSSGLLVLSLVGLQIAIRLRTTLPPPAAGIPQTNRRLSQLVHGAMYLLLVSVPLMGYAMSSSYSLSDGITFFGIPITELLPKDDARFELFQWMHKIMAYTLLALIGLHVAAVVKHRYLDKSPGRDVLPRMM